MYRYKLTVSDEQGLTGSEKVTINVAEDPLMMNLVEVILTAKASALSQQEVKIKIIQTIMKLIMLINIPFYSSTN